MADIRRRVAEKKAKGLYSVDALALGAADETAPLAQDELERTRDLAVQRVELAAPVTGPPVLGPLVAKVKYRLTRAVSQPLYAMTSQASSFNIALVGYVARLGREVAALRAELDSTRADAGRAARRAETLAEALQRTERRLAEAETRLAALRAEGLHERLARLERGAATGPPALTVAAETPPPGGVLGVMLEARDWSEDDVERWSAALADAAGPVLHVGAGSGRALARLGAGAMGVDDDRELAAAAAREERAVTCADPVEFSAALGPDTLGGALVTGLVERLDAGRLAALAAGLARALRDGAPLVVEGIDPRAPDELWRDPRRTRPLHPDAVVAVLEAAGMTIREVRGPDEHGPARYAVHAVA